MTKPPERRAPTNVQARRVFSLARLLTAVTAVVFLWVHAGLLVLTYYRPGAVRSDWDAWAVDVRWWLGVFAFWAGVMWLARRPLRLDALDRERR